MNYNFDEIISRAETNSVKFDLRKHIFGHKDVIPMWVADMDFKTPDFVINAITARLQHEILGYTFIPQSFYNAITKWILRRHQWKIQSDWISFSPGIVPAINLLIMTYTEPGDEVIIQPPVYFPFFSAVKNHDRKLVTSPLIYENGQYRMDLEDLESKISSDTRLFILCNPHNPTGNVWPAEVLKKAGEICLKHNVLMISDEIHSDLIMPGFRHIPAAGLSDEMAFHTITCMAPSKTFNLAGLSTAYLIIPNPALKAKYDEMLDRVHVGAGNIFGFVAAEAAYEHGDSWLDQLMAYLDGNLIFLKEFITAKIPQISVVPAQATYLIWLDCRKLNMSSADLKMFMIKAGLGLNDGPQFGIEGEGFQRINIGCPREILHQALIKLKLAIDHYFTK